MCLFFLDLNQTRMFGKCEVVLKVGNGTSVSALAIGNTFITILSRYVSNLSEYLYILGVFRNIVSIPKLVKKNYEIFFC